jgi:hypothetical protein
VGWANSDLGVVLVTDRRVLLWAPKLRGCFSHDITYSFSASSQATANRSSCSL